jgi:hypothetical protein
VTNKPYLLYRENGGGEPHGEWPHNVYGVIKKGKVYKTDSLGRGYAFKPTQKHQEETKRNGNEYPGVVEEIGGLLSATVLTCIGCDKRIA